MEWVLQHLLQTDCSETLREIKISNTPLRNDHGMAENKHLFSLLCLAIQCIRGSRSRNGRPQTESSSQGSNAELVTVEAGLPVQLN